MKLDTTPVLEQRAVQHKRRKLSFADLPWDTVGIVLDFSPKTLYPMFRLNRSITKLVNRRVTGLTFNKMDITETIFFAMLKKYSLITKTLQITQNLKQIKKASFDKVIVRPTQL